MGKQVTFYPYRTRPIIGIGGAARKQTLHDPPPPHIYESLGNNPADHLKVLVRTSSAPLQLVDALRRTIRSLDPHIPIDRAAPFAAWLRDALVASRLYTLFLASFAVLALALAVSGAHGIPSYSVTRRSMDIGIRVTLGAGQAAVVSRIVWRGCAP